MHKLAHLELSKVKETYYRALHLLVAESRSKKRYFVERDDQRNCQVLLLLITVEIQL